MPVSWWNEHALGRRRVVGEMGTVLAVAGSMLALFLVALGQTVVGTALPKRDGRSPTTSRGRPLTRSGHTGGLL